MKKRFMTVALVGTLIASMSMSSCIGSFALTNKLLDWNDTVGNKFVNELVFFAFLIVPVYEVAALADVLVLNSIEFWSGESPVASNSSIIEGKNGKYLVDCDSKGYTITRMDSNQKVRLNFEPQTKTWSVQDTEGTEYPLMTFVDDSHVKVITPSGEMMLVERSEAGLYAYQQAVLQTVNVFAMK